MKVLYVEDNPLDADLLRRELARQGSSIEVDVVQTVGQAYRQLGEPTRYQLVLLDLQLPDCSGLELLKEIRRQSLPLAVVILTGHGDEESAVAALKAGANDYQVKREGYLARLPLVMETALARFQAEEARRGSLIRVLYVEHNPADVDLTRRHLSRDAPYIHLEVLFSAPGALQRLSGPGDPCDVLLLDYRLQGMNALEMIKVLHQEMQLDIPVVMVTGQGDEEIAIQALRLGAVEYITKHPGYLFKLPAVLENAYHLARLMRKQAALRESEARFRDLFNHAGDAIFIYDLGAKFLEVNQVACRRLGYSREELLAKDPREIVSPEFSAKIPQRIRLVQEQGQAIFETAHVRRDGSTIPTELSSRAFQYRGKPAIISIARDITDRKQAQEKLRRREQEFRALVENAPDIVARFDRDLRHTYINPAIEKHTGKPPGQYLGRSSEEVRLPEQQSEQWVRVLQEVFDSGEEKEFFFNHETLGGRQYYHARLVPEFSPAGAVDTVLSISRDITGLKEMEAALLRERLKTRSLHRRSIPEDFPLIAGLSLAACYQPAPEMQGDSYNVISRGNHLLIYMVDIEGKRDDGIMHSLFVGKAVEEYLDSWEHDRLVSPAVLLGYLAEQCRHNFSGAGCPSIFIGVFDLPERARAVPGGGADYRPGVLRYASKGFKAPPLIVTGSGEAVHLSLGGPPHPLGGGRESRQRFQEHSIGFGPGSTFFISTDGLGGDRQGKGPCRAPLTGLLAGHCHLPPELIGRAVTEEYLGGSLAGEPGGEDDAAFLLVQALTREDRLSLKVESDFLFLEKVLVQVTSFIQSRVGLEGDLLHFHEILVNAMEHGNKCDGGKMVSVDVTVTESYYKIVITDQGEGFNWRDRVQRGLNLDGDCERGRGIAMTGMMVDYLGYNERGNRATIIKLIK